MNMNTIVFRDATVLDGTGAAPFRADVRVIGPRIAPRPTPRTSSTAPVPR